MFFNAITKIALITVMIFKCTSFLNLRKIFSQNRTWYNRSFQHEQSTFGKRYSYLMRSIQADSSMGVPSILSRRTRSTAQEHPTDPPRFSTSRIIRAGPNQWHREKSNRSPLFPAAAEEEDEEEVLEFHVKTSFMCPVWQRRWSIHR